MSDIQIDNLFQQAVQLQHAGLLGEAETLYRRILEAEPRSPDVLNALAIVAQARGESESAVELLRRAIAVNPVQADYHFNLGVIFASGGRISEAVESLGVALNLNPDHVRAAVNIGFIEYERGDLPLAIRAWRRAVQAGSLDPQVFFALGSALRETGEPADAAVQLRRALDLDPGFAEAANNLGLTFREQGDLDQAISVYRSLVTSRPEFSEGWNNLGMVLLEMAQHDEALDCFGRAVDRGAGAQAASNRLYCMLFNPRFDLRQILDEHEKWNRRFVAIRRPYTPHHSSDLGPDRRLRVGYVSPNFRNHVVGRFMLPLCKHHDHRQFETFFYDDSVASDAVTRQLEACTDVWRKTRSLSDAELAAGITEDHIDILVDLNMHMEGSRLLAFARKPAPIQVTYLAYAGTTGLAAMDYRLTDPYLDPPSSDQSVYSEPSLRLARSYWCYPTPSEAPEVTPPPAGQRGYTTFGCLNSFSKINAGVLDLWGQLMRGVEDSRLLLHAPQGSSREAVLARMARRGIDGGRVSFVGRTSGPDYFARYGEIDVGLDPFPYPGGTTTCDALWMGVPVVTLAGRGAIARAGVSVLNNVGMGEFVASSPEEYLAIATYVAKDLGRLHEIRNNLRSKMAASSLMDAGRFARDVEEAYRTMWTSYVQGRR